jgi:hypothetical protein
MSKHCCPYRQHGNLSFFEDDIYVPLASLIRRKKLSYGTENTGSRKHYNNKNLYYLYKIITTFYSRSYTSNAKLAGAFLSQLYTPNSRGTIRHTTKSLAVNAPAVQQDQQKKLQYSRKKIITLKLSHIHI